MMGQAPKGERAHDRDLENPPRRSHQRSKRSTLAHLPKHLQLAITSYRRQADESGDLDPTIRQFLDRIIAKEPRASVMARLVAFDRTQTALKAGTILSREWNGVIHRATVVDDGFLWNGSKYDSLSAIALAITGTRWNGPRFFGLRDGAKGGGEKS
jgi:hypothetical protein